ncbi:ParB/RepB/Spo0J family partition protein [Klenkia taihuensis]|uniref:Chromosome partitioning protein, ParB family n=1 Tax=Klenkia taihuensis TaxID=1225127 RepID=A0A1I1GPH9_9ACTN|nr:ParB/RepB/Spo0J family partition protein [Klenkia taihuensis]GHE09609.1 chromosome partitioning protein ParB [Klenkia taihuensis]SFC13657.1 chromosome partitioning protein, ParB family [Klenkia taihuensis]
MTKRGGLGRGLAALIPTSAPAATATPAARAAEAVEAAAERAAAGLAPAPALAPVADRPEEVAGIPGAQLREVAVTDVVPNPKQPRLVFDDEALEELTHSVKEFGLLQPIVVRERSEGGYELIMGERRLRAARAAELETVPAIVRDTSDDAMLRDALLENIHRVQLNPLEEAAAYQQLLEEFGATHEELAGRIGRSRSQVTNTIRLMKLPVKVQTRVAAGVLSAGHARALLGLPTPEAMDALATRIVAEGMSVRATEEAVALAVAHEPEAKRKSGRTITAPGVEDLAHRLSDAFETKVKVQIGRAKGRIVVEFGSVDDLQRIVGMMAPEITGRSQPPA